MEALAQEREREAPSSECTYVGGRAAGGYFASPDAAEFGSNDDDDHPTCQFAT